MKAFVYTLVTISIFIIVSIFMIANPNFSVSEKINVPNIHVNKEYLYSHVSELTKIYPPRNFYNVESLNKSAEYITNKFKEYGSRINVQNFIVNGNEYKNIICSFGPENIDRVIVGAHYDVCGDQPGADDNASGVAGLLEIARLLKELNPKLKNRIDLVAYTLEEPPFFRSKFMGSFVHAKSLSDSKIKVKAMICLEMIGYFSESDKSQRFPLSILKLFYPSKGNFIAVVGNFTNYSLVKKIKRYIIEGSNVETYSINAPSFIPGIDFSDHLNYWKHNYDAVMITDTAFYRNDNYHEYTDTFETLNFDKMAEVVKGIYWAVINM
jgi:Zn-dependent M28 family amino/carboxypeptidase